MDIEIVKFFNRSKEKYIPSIVGQEKSDIFQNK